MPRSRFAAQSCSVETGMPVMRDTSFAVSTSSIAIVIVTCFFLFGCGNSLFAWWSGCEKRFVVFGSTGDALGDGAHDEFVEAVRCGPRNRLGR
jgi:hypothetical protein